MLPTSLPSMYHRMVGLGSAVSAFLGSQPTVIDSSLVSYTSFAVLMRGGDNLSAVTKKKFSGYQIFGINHRQTSQNEDLKYIIIFFYYRNWINYNIPEVYYPLQDCSRAKWTHANNPSYFIFIFALRGIYTTEDAK